MNSKPVSHTTKKELCNVVAGNLIISQQRRTQCIMHADQIDLLPQVCVYVLAIMYRHSVKDYRLFGVHDIGPLPMLYLLYTQTII